MKLQWRRVTNTEPPADDRAYRVTQSLDDSTLFVRRGKEIWFLRQQVENNSGWNWYAGPIPEPLPPELELELPDDWRVFHDGATVAAIEEEAEEEVMDFVHGLRRAIHTHCWRIAVKKRVSTGGIEDPEVAQIVVDDQSRRRCVLRINAAIKALEEE